MFFNGWSAVGRTALFGLIAYIALVAFLRVSGKRTLSMMDPFDFVITTALGSTLAQTILSPGVSLAEGLSAFAILIALQFAVTLLNLNTKFMRHLIKPDPQLLFYRGEFLYDAMKQERVHEVEIRAAVRSQGIASLEEVEAVVLEANSSFSVIKRSDKSPTAMCDIHLRTS
ncbi:MAG TPA: YetF domain-containing protein [Blastocatellia bacterium]|nr:YetF domain-containing protein [Blastocatellia bacterium]